MTELQYNYVVPQEKLYSINAWKHKENTEQDSEDYAMAQQRIKCTSKVGGESSRESIYGSNPVFASDNQLSVPGKYRVGKTTTT